MLPLFDLNTDEGRRGLERLIERLRHSAASHGEAAQTVAQIIAEVKNHGDKAVVRYMREWVDPDFCADRIRVSPDELAQAEQQLDPTLAKSLQASIDHVHQYQQHILPICPGPVKIDDAELRLRFVPVDRVGLTVPGGTAALFSTLIMLGVPALVAGVDPDRISVVNPPPTRVIGQSPTASDPTVLAVCKMIGINKVYRIGGAQAVAALAFGTESIDPVDLIAGPGNVYVQLAKAQVRGVTGTEGGFYGPSEIVTLADQTADPQWIAADLIAQAEHDPGRCLLITWSTTLLDGVRQALAEQLPQRRRIQAIRQAFEQDSGAILTQDQTQALEVANRLAPEHLSLAVADPQSLLPQIQQAGQIFLGDASPVAAGDYYAGSSHCLPTGTTARFSSGVSVYTYLRRSGTIQYPKGPTSKSIEHISRLAESEGLDGHAESIRIRHTNTKARRHGL